MYFLSIIVLCFLFLETFGRPPHVLLDYDKDSRDSSYRDNDIGETDDYQHNDKKSSAKQFSGETGSKAELDEGGPGSNEEIDHAHPDKDYLENDEEQTDAAHLSHDDVNIDVKRTANSNGIILFTDNKPQKIETNDYNRDDRVRPSHNNRYLKQYHTLPDIERDTLVRDRREIRNNNLNDPIGTDEISTQKNELNANENEETAIRRHVKKLSKEELDDLLHSLSEDKKALLKNIIDNCQQEYDNINKREITKKAGANEENSFVGNEQSDTSKLQCGSANLEAESSMEPNFDKEDNTKKSDTESMYSKSPETSNSSEKSNDKMSPIESIADKTPDKSESIENLDSSNTESKIISNPVAEKESSKKENKREIDLKSSVESESIVEEPAILKSNKDDLYCSDNEALSQLWNEESSLHNDNKYKRDVYSDDIDSIISLEESFPNADDTNNLIGSDMALSVRVKRDNPEKDIDKRDENVASNLKVPYFSSALENNEEESNEGSEFQNDGFFDRGANFVKSGELTKRGIDISKGNNEKNNKYCRNSQSLYIDKNKLETDTADLGSDTDVVLSGIEGVDDNMMYNSIARIRRTGNTFDNSNIEGETAKLRQENNQQFSFQNENNEISEDNNNVASYQENDAFGSLPRNYEQDLGRFKRIRRLKPENNALAA